MNKSNKAVKINNFSVFPFYDAKECIVPEWLEQDSIVSLFLRIKPIDYLFQQTKGLNITF